MLYLIYLLTSNVFLRYSLFFSSTSNSLKSRVKFRALRPIVSTFCLISCTNGITLFIYFFSSALPANAVESALLSGNLFPFFYKINKDVNAQEKLIIAKLIIFGCHYLQSTFPLSL